MGLTLLHNDERIKGKIKVRIYDIILFNKAYERNQKHTDWLFLKMPKYRLGDYKYG